MPVDSVPQPIMTPPSPIVAEAADQRRLLESPDPQLAANKKLVYDMYRTVLQGGHYETVEQFFTPGYIQHNPNVASGRDSLAAFIHGSRPQRPIEDKLGLPLINIIAERDTVVMAFRRIEKDEAGKEYITTWFDLFRIENGKIAEHWDPALKSAAMLKFDPNSQRR